jgi:hypothetical protein
MEVIQSEQQKEKKLLKNEQSLRDLWGHWQRFKIHLTGIPEGEKRAEKVLKETMAINYPNLARDIDLQIH